MFRRLRVRLFLSHLITVFLVSGSMGSYFYLAAVDRIKTGIQVRLQSSASLVAEAIDPSCLQNSDHADYSSSSLYLNCLEKLRAQRRSNQDIAFLYVMRLKANGDVVFVIDTDESADQAAPGDVYEAAPAELLAGFSGPSVDSELTTDQWGVFLSGYAPIKSQPEPHLVGIDMRANAVGLKLRSLNFAALVSFVTAILLAMLFSSLLSKRLTAPISVLTQRCREIAGGRFDLPSAKQASIRELRLLQGAFEDMLSELTQTRKRREEALAEVQSARDQLEAHVAERTEELEQTNRKLRREIAEREVVQKELRRIAQTDPLTGLLNRRAMLERMDYETIRASRDQQQSSLILIDIDFFKRVNDQHGHAAGDDVLVEVSNTLRSECRAQDSVARWGGEELLILLPDTDLQGAINVAEHLRQKVSDLRFSSDEGEFQITISAGVSACQPGCTHNANVRAADTALYQAKDGGRNQVVAASA